jgi:hypothetical protein
MCTFVALVMVLKDIDSLSHTKSIMINNVAQ